MMYSFAAVVSSVGLCTAALAQQFANPGFETGDFTGWTIVPTSSGQTLVQTVEVFDIDGAGPLEPSPAAKFSVGSTTSGGGSQEGIELVQSLPLVAGTGYRLSFNWAVSNDGVLANSEGGVFAAMVDGALLAAQGAGPVVSNTRRYGLIETYFVAADTATLPVGARLTRDAVVTASVAADLHQWVDNFSIQAIATGACCRAYQGCVVAAGSEHCEVLGGDYLGTGTPCPPGPSPTCEPIGATVRIIDIPEYTGTHFSTSAAWGFWFTAPRDMVIVGLRVPDESGQQFQNVEVVRLDGPPPAGAAAPTNDFVSLFRRVGTRSDQIIEAGISIQAGDVIGILANAGISGMYHSLGAGGTEPLIAGQPVVLRRLAMSGNLNQAPASNLYTAGTVTADLARVEVHYHASAECYANCTGSTQEPILSVADFICFIDQFAAAQTLPLQEQINHYANCNGATTEPVLSVGDFICFIDAFAAGCP